MFDRYDMSSKFPKCIDITHTEKKAPTDESVRLLKEMEKEARSRVSESLIAISNSVKFSMAISPSVIQGCEVHIKLKLNDSEFSESWSSDWMTRDKLFEEISKRISSWIVKECCIPQICFHSDWDYKSTFRIQWPPQEETNG